MRIQSESGAIQTLLILAVKHTYYSARKDAIELYKVQKESFTKMVCQILIDGVIPKIMKFSVFQL